MKHTVLIDETAIAARVAELAATIRADLTSTSPVFVGLLTGSFVFVADLARAASRVGLEPEVDFMAVSHYSAGTVASGRVEVYKDTARNLSGRAVLLIDDILDSGHTMTLVRDHIARQGPAWLRTCALLDKPSRRQVEIQADYVGFEVPDVWLVGYGLDAGGYGRALPYIAAVEPAAADSAGDDAR
ncbi:MAG: hypoxanthine phosphoribosyltransferase [Deltaproteobacteria bacterium]|nr:hypoxanthine phosphoribosyltransferase [Deltaproteobacteria bacterium]